MLHIFACLLLEIKVMLKQGHTFFPANALKKTIK